MSGAEIVPSDGPEASWGIVEENLGLVARLARTFRGFRVPVEDLEAEGRIGLFEAATRFDPGHGVKFSTYATWWVLKRIREATAAQATLVRVPRSRVELRRRARAAETDLRVALGRAPSAEEIAVAARIPADEIDVLRAEGRREVSLDDPVPDGGRLCFAEILPQTLVPSPDDAALLEDGRLRIERTLDRLPDRHRAVLVLRYGLDGAAPKALAEIAQTYGISRERVHQLEREAIARLRRLLRIR